MEQAQVRILSSLPEQWHLDQVYVVPRRSIKAVSAMHENRFP